MASSPAALLEERVPTYFNCTWDYDDPHNSYTTEMPCGFISTNINDWNKIILNTDAALVGTYKVNCINEVGSVVEDYITAQPFYDCPENSRLSYDNTTREVGCTSSPTSCLADIVGREFDSSGLGNLGHVGLTNTWEAIDPAISVLQVMPSGINVVMLYGPDSFTSPGGYWGERYRLKDYPKLSLNDALNIVWTGGAQAAYIFNYNSGWGYYPGGTAEHPDNCKFRCDSFVYYCYDAGAGLKIQDSFNPPTDPKTIFNDFLCSADPKEPCRTPTELHDVTISLTNTNLDMLDKVDITARNSTAILSALRLALVTKTMQREQLPFLIKKFQYAKNLEIQELFARCLCFELEKIDPENIDTQIKSWLSFFLLQYKYLSYENFPLIIMEGKLKTYTDKPFCRWLNAYFNVNANTRDEKEKGMIDYIDRQNSTVEQANLVSGSRPTLSVMKRCEYGRLFQKAYNHDKSLSDRDRRLLRLGLVEIKFYSPNESLRPNSLCR